MSLALKAEAPLDYPARVRAIGDLIAASGDHGDREHCLSPEVLEALYAADLFRMFTRYAETRGWKVEPMDSSPSDLGGMKEVIFGVNGQDASRYTWLSGCRSSRHEKQPASVFFLKGRAMASPGAPPWPREAWPVGALPSWRAEALSISQPVSTPSSISARRSTGSPSASKPV